MVKLVEIFFGSFLLIAHDLASFAKPTIVLPVHKNENGLTYFLTEKMRNYTSWIKDLELDPSPTLATNIVLISKDDASRVSISLRLVNFRLLGHSSQIVDYSNGYGNLTEKMFFVNRTTTLTYDGNYTATGKINGGPDDGLEFNGVGMWQMSPKDLKFGEMLVYQNYQVTDDGYLTIEEEVTTSKYFYFDDVDPDQVHFEGLWDSEEMLKYEQDVKMEISNIYNAWMRYDFPDEDYYPLQPLLRSYLREMFLSASLKEIEEWAEPPPVLPTTSSIL